MRQITEQQITALAPNPAAAANGRKISQKGRFVRLERSADDTFFLGECTGSGAKNYITSADFLDPARRCSAVPAPAASFPSSTVWPLVRDALGQGFSCMRYPGGHPAKAAKKEARATKAAGNDAEKQEKAPKKFDFFLIFDFCFGRKKTGITGISGEKIPPTEHLRI